MVPTLRRRPEPSSTTRITIDRPVLRRNPSPENVMRPEASAPPPPPAMVNGTLPAGTNLVIRMIDAVDSETNRVGQTFRASLDQPVMVDGNTVIPRGADAMVKLVDSKESGKLTGRADLTLSLQSVRVNGRMVDINTQSINKEGTFARREDREGGRRHGGGGRDHRRDRGRRQGRGDRRRRGRRGGRGLAGNHRAARRCAFLRKRA